MNNSGREITGAKSSVLAPVLLLLLFLLIAPALAASNFSQAFLYSDIVHVNQTYQIDQTGGTPIVIWIGAIVLGICLIVLSFGTFPNGEEILLSIGAWFPLWYAAVNSFAVDMVAGYGATSLIFGSTQTFALMIGHTVYQWPVLTAASFALAVGAIGNTYRIHLNARRLGQQEQPPADDVES